MPKTATTPTFESALAELEALIAQMEHGDMPLEASLAAYQRGGELLKFCQAKLVAAEQQIQVLDGEALKPYTPAP